ncbi:MAG TPA: hypothetical protein VEA41_03535, partial [Salinarimonas sp.]|nr:hypothetical protein [Salinarimonas sp.]
EWMHVLSSHAHAGHSIYQSGNVIDGKARYANFGQRDDAWGAAEYNPYRQGGTETSPTFVTDPAVMEEAVDEAWTTGAHVLWPHYWGSTSHPVFGGDRWERDDATLNLAGWSATNVVKIFYAGKDRFLCSGSPATLDSPALTLDADETDYLALQFACYTGITQSLGITPLETATLTVEFQKGGSWYTDTSATFRLDTIGRKWFVVDLRANVDWSGTITALKLHVAPQLGNELDLGVLLAARDNLFTEHLRDLMVDQANVARPQPPAVFAPTFPFDLAPALATLHGSSHLKAYDADPLNGYDSDDFNDEHTDFGLAGNFFRDTVATAGGVARDAIVQPPSSYLGLRKTARFRRIQLPADAPVSLVFRVGILDDAPVDDGVEFAVHVRGEDRRMETVHRVLWRQNAWSDEVWVDLAEWQGQAVEIFFEVHDHTVADGEIAAWAEPRLWRRHTLTLSAFPANGGTVTPAGSTSWFEVVHVWASATPTPGSGYAFSHWEVVSGTPGTSTFFDPLDAATQVPMSTHVELVAHFRKTLVLDSQPNRDGWVLESSETSGAGGSSNDAGAGTSALRVGDDSGKRQYRSILSFATGDLPDDAVLDSVALGMTRGSLTGAVTTFGALEVDIVTGHFGLQLALENRDFQSTPSSGYLASVATLTVPAADDGTSSASLSAAGVALVDRTGPTQLRLAFATDDDDDGADDFVGFFSGDHATAAKRPKLTIRFFIPD